MVEDGAFSHNIDYVEIFCEDSKSQRASQSHYWFKSYSNFAEWLDLACWWSFSVGGFVINRAFPAPSSFYVYIYLSKQLYNDAPPQRGVPLSRNLVEWFNCCLVLGPLAPGPRVGWEWVCYGANPPIAQLWVPTPAQFLIGDVICDLLFFTCLYSVNSSLSFP